jgi:hypothetical protein
VPMIVTGPALTARSEDRVSVAKALGSARPKSWRDPSMSAKPRLLRKRSKCHDCR